MRTDLSGRVAFVTGGNVGIGRAIALALADAGADVAITHRSHDGSGVAGEIRALGRRALDVELDVTDGRAVEAAADRVVRELGRLDILVNNAGGILDRIRVADMDDEFWGRVITLNLTAAMYCARAAARVMDRSWGRIVNISSAAAHTGGGPGTVAYASAKAGVLGLTRGLARELAPGITVNAVAPGFIGGTLLHTAHTSPADRDAFIATTLAKREGTPDDVAAAVLYLVSEGAGYVTGVVIDVNGGAHFA
jgi:3-oxoacyl-[acyl-carrier protein] reductase